jgi:K(+)-stimulated pyrophosphate-energized sodium pump
MRKFTLFFLLLISQAYIYAGESNLAIPQLSQEQNILLEFGLAVCVLGILFGLYQFRRVKNMPAHKSMLEVAGTIWETCKTYLKQQAKFLFALFIIIAVVSAFYFGVLSHISVGGVLLILLWTVLGILGSSSVALYGMRMNTLANARTAFSGLEGKPLKTLNVALDAGMSVGVFLVCIELIMMLIILLFVPRDLAGDSFIGFAIGESLGASALRIAGGIFTKIADIGSDLMKIVFKIKEDDPRNPGVIADCTGDNAGDSVGPTADGFETFGVTQVALITFIVLAVQPALQTHLLVWIFIIRILLIITSIAAFYVNKAFSRAKFAGKEDFNFEQPLTSLVWFASIISIIAVFIVSYFEIGPASDVGTQIPNLWLLMSIIMSSGTLGAALIPEFVKIFTSTKSAHVAEVVKATREGGASLNILSGLVAGNFSSFWIGMVIMLLMFIGYYASTFFPSGTMIYPAVFAFGLVAFGFLSMGPVTIAVDSYGPVTDNAQSIYELSLIETIPNIQKEVHDNFGFEPDFERAKHYLEANDGAGNTFKATAKPVLIATAVVGATTLIFSLILLIKQALGVEPETILNLLNPFTIIGFMAGGAVIFWFTGASIQSVTTGAYKAVDYIKRHIHLDADANQKAATESSKEVVKICTQYAQKGMWNIFFAIFSFALAFACLSAPAGSNEPVSLFVSYLIAIAAFGLFQAVFMANAGGSWDNAKKVVEVDLKEKGTALHDATVVGDTVGDPYKDTSSVSLNPIIKFTTLFGLLAMEIAITPSFRHVALIVGFIFLLSAFYFVWRSFYGMRIPSEEAPSVQNDSLINESVQVEK